MKRKVEKLWNEADDNDNDYFGFIKLKAPVVDKGFRRFRQNGNLFFFAFPFYKMTKVSQKLKVRREFLMV